tara:strand:- start:1170 stop:1535 length:366 start_codon:yes stop_codon:yes gene_type:complete
MKLGEIGALGAVVEAALISFFVGNVDFSEDGTEWLSEHDPQDIEYYPINLERWLKGESISNVDYSPPAESGLTVDKALVQGSVIAPMLSGGNIGSHDISVTVTTDTGRQRNRKIKLRVKDL